MLALAGCEGNDVWVGQLEEGLNLDVCVGDETDCDPNVDPETLTTPEPRSCDGELQHDLEVDFSAQLADAICPDADHACDLNPIELAVAADGSSWVLGLTHVTNDESGEQLWVACYDAEGELDGVTDVAAGVPFNGGSVLHEADLALDQRGHAFVLVYENDAGPNADSAIAERVWFTELDRRGRPVNGAVSLAGIGAGHIAVNGDGEVVIAASALQNGRHGVLAKLTADGERVWSQTDVRTTGQGKGYGVVGLGSDGSDHALVLAERSRKGDDVTLALTRFDTVGNAVWDRAIDVPLGNADLTVDAQGGVVIDADTPGVVLGDGASRPERWIAHVRANGVADWAYLLTGVNTASPALDPSTGDVYVVGYQIAEPNALTVVAEVSAGGEQCALHAVELDAPHGQLVANGDGLYFLTQFSFGRLRFTGE